MVDAQEVRELAEHAPATATAGKVDLSDVPETDFAQEGTVRGKYAGAFARASGLVRLDPDIRSAFPDDAAVNRALRQVLGIVKDVRHLT